MRWYVFEIEERTERGNWQWRSKKVPSQVAGLVAEDLRLPTRRHGARFSKGPGRELPPEGAFGGTRPYLCIGGKSAERYGEGGLNDRRLKDVCFVVVRLEIYAKDDRTKNAAMATIDMQKKHFRSPCVWGSLTVRPGARQTCMLVLGKVFGVGVNSKKRLRLRIRLTLLGLIVPISLCLSCKTTRRMEEHRLTYR
jgi:hypothetical protein